LEAFVTALRKSGCQANDGRQFTRTKLLALISEKDDSIQQKFQEELFEGAKTLSTGQWSEAYDVTKQLIIKWLKDYFDVEPNDDVKSFLEETFLSRIAERNIQEDAADDVPITIGTVHSVKGMTHCATMYVETSYNNQYESNYIIEEKTTGRGSNKVTSLTSPLFKQDLEVKGKNAAMAKRMLYVGFSRPTHLLCFASDRGLWNEDRINKMREAGWNIETV
jgi:superfamily I DNA/RNA helicase